MRYGILFIMLLHLSGMAQQGPYIYILGTAQDGGYPHAGCEKKCCSKAWDNKELKRNVVSFALVSPADEKWWLFEATPDIKDQLHDFNQFTKGAYKYLPDGIFITHAHIGHYTGLMQLGREVMGAKNIPVYVLPQMKNYLETNGPWSQLVKLKNITLNALAKDALQELTNSVQVLAFTVPHRDEYSETAGFKIITPDKKYLFIPDIDKWSKWNKDIINEVKTVDVALLDATFYDSTELPNRAISEVPHPLVSETILLFKEEDAGTRAKIHFIHFNHTNPLIWNDTSVHQLTKQGFNTAKQGQKL